MQQRLQPLVDTLRAQLGLRHAPGHLAPGAWCSRMRSGYPALLSLDLPAQGVARVVHTRHLPRAPPVQARALTCPR